MRATARMWVVARKLKPGSLYIDPMTFLMIAFTMIAAGWLFDSY